LNIDPAAGGIILLEEWFTFPKWATLLYFPLEILVAGSVKLAHGPAEKEIQFSS
jgi:hypothetical protein